MYSLITLYTCTVSYHRNKHSSEPCTATDTARTFQSRIHGYTAYLDMFIHCCAWRPLGLRFCWLSTESAERLKLPAKGGQNLSKRYRRLEKSLRGKEALAQSIEEELSGKIPSSQPFIGGKDDTEYFRGFVIPKAPKVPESDGMTLLLICVPNPHSLLAQNAACQDARYACTISTKNPSTTITNPSRVCRPNFCLSVFPSRNGPLVCECSETVGEGRTSSWTRFKKWRGPSALSGNARGVSPSH
jgi:hypothetical protein